MTDDARAQRTPDDPRAWLLVPLTAVLVALLLIFFVFFDYSTVDGDSMNPTLLAEDKLLLTKGYDGPRRGDVVVFRLNEGGTEVEVLKRIVGVPGDTVETLGDRAVVNGNAEPGWYAPLVGGSRRVVGPLVVPKGMVFVLGDNRPVSLDSRFIGLVDLKSVHGRVVAIFTPVTRLRLLDAGRSAP